MLDLSALPCACVSGDNCPRSTAGNFRFSQQTNFLKDELYIGLTKAGGEIVSESEWQEFVKTVITPHFRERLIVLDGSGQFFNSSGILIREKSKIVILIYEQSPEKDRAINAILESYKRSFQQESVLRTTSEVKVSS